MAFDMGSFAGSAASALIGAAGSVVGAGLSYSKQRKLAELQYKHQKEFAQNGIQWKTQDAIKAGLHPLYAIGASGASYTPSSITDGGIGDAVSQFGQNMGRAVEAGMNYEERKLAEETSRKIQEAQLARIEAETAESNMRTKEAQFRMNRSYIQDQYNAMQFLNSLRQVSRASNPPQPSARVRYTQVSNNPSKIVPVDKPSTGYGQVYSGFDYRENPDGSLSPMISAEESARTQNLGILGLGIDAFNYAGNYLDNFISGPKYVVIRRHGKDIVYKNNKFLNRRYSTGMTPQQFARAVAKKAILYNR